MKNRIHIAGSHVLPLILVVSFFAATAFTTRAATLVQEFYLPMPEQQIYQANSAIISGTGQTNFSTFSVVVTGSGTAVHYDHWEDGYEINLSSPAQSSTLVWGDGNNGNGICPGFATDPAGLSAGTVITLTNNVPLPRNPSVILWDARDRVAATKALVISRAAWPIPTGPVFAGAVGVLSTLDYGTNFVSPVGQDQTNVNLFKYVGMFVMAAQNNTAVTIDPNGNGVGTTSIVLNQGESYLVNGGIKKGGRISSSKPVQADLLVGRVGARYASDWFTLYPVEQWDNTYYTPVSSAASGTQPAYVYLYNPSSNAITINYSTRAGGGSFAIPGTNGVYQFPMPIGSGASFASAGGQNFFAICTVAANNSSDTAYNWGFTLVPQAALTTEATVGWGPGSADGTVNGSPVWVTTLGATTVYVDYKGDKAGPLTDPDGGKYDTNFTVVNLQSLKIFDPSKNQTGMRVYTVDGTLLTAAWGEDADKASPGNPYIDAGTTVLPFPVPVLLKTAAITNDTAPAGLSLGDTIQYTVQIDNKGLLPLGNTIVIDAPSANLTYITNSSTWNGTPIPDSVSGTPFPLDAPGFTIPLILSRGSSVFQYQFQVAASGMISNSVNIGGTPISTFATLDPAPTNGVAVNIRFTDTNGVTVALYVAGADVFVTLTNAVGNTLSNSVQSILVTVTDPTSGDAETITLTETGNNTGVFRNTVGLPTSLTLGIVSQNGILKVAPGDTLNVSYTEPTYGSSSSANAAIQIPAQTKQLYLTGTNAPDQGLDRISPVAAGDVTTAQSVVLGGGGTFATNAIGVGASLSTNALGSTLNFNYTTGSGSDRLMLVTVGIQNNLGGAPTMTGVTYNGLAMDLVSSATKSGSNPKYGIYLYALKNPPAGTYAVAVTGSGGVSCAAGVTTFSNVNQTVTFNATNSAAPGSSITVNSGTNQLVFGAIYNEGTTSLAAAQNAATPWYVNGALFDLMGNTVAGSNAVSTSIFWQQSAYAVGVSINPSATLTGGSGGTNVTSFTQSPVFCSAFTIPSNNVVTITNYITVTNGSLSANPNITATLRYGTTNFLTITNPVYSSASNTLVWSGVLSSNVTIPAGAAISYIISNNVAGVAFRIDYDSVAKPSKISLPASTVINVDTFAIYDAPYPGGSIVNTPVAGTTLYVRANVTDPFGSYDITSLGLAFTAPDTNNNFNVLLSDANLVDSDTCSKTYEYTWATGPAVGSYTIAATANEGTEGVTATASAGITTIFLDLGTASTTEFTSGNNGVATNSYLANSSVCVRVTDLDRNTNASTAQSVIATVTSSAGDSEILTLTETGTNTGIFTFCFNTSTNASFIPNNGTLTAPVGSVLTANYTDPTDASDSSSATANIQPLPGVPGVVMNKTIVSPSGGQVGVGQPVIYNLQVVNVGSTTLPSLQITDTFTAGKLSYSSASVTPDVIGTGTLTWNNLGAFAPGQSTNITVTFTTLATGTATNSATANGSTATNSSSVTLAVNSAAVNVVKVLLTPTNQPVSIQSNVVFRITIQNVGNTAINYLPMQDTFSGAYYEYVSATIPPDGTGFGSLIWTNLASSVLTTNAILTNDITMKIVGQGSPANNTATVDFATDMFGNPVPTTSSSVGVTTSSAGISGVVYNDIHQLGVYSNGYTGLANVTLDLYTDPDSDGDPADGALVQVTTTDSSGYYELLNLTMGSYVVVETDLPGYSSSAPVNNSLSLNLTNLVMFTNNFFFDYIPAPSVYSSFSGTVFDDLLGTGLNTSQAGLGNVTIDLVQDVNSNGIVDLGEPVASSATTDTNGNYFLSGITPGHYVLLENDNYGYYSSGDSQPPNDSQIAFVTTNGIVSTNNNFFDRLSPVANDDTNSTSYYAPIVIDPLVNDVSPNGDVLTLSNATSAFGLVVINPGSTNLTFTPTNTGTATISYTIADQHGGSSSAVITVDVSLAPLTITADSTGKIYGQTATFAGTEFTVVGLTNGDSVTSVTLTSAGAVNTAIVGSYAIIPSAAIGSGLANYAITYATNGLLAVNPATLGITANDTNRLYNTANPAFTYTPSGFVNGDTASVLSGAPDLTTTAILSSPAGTYPINATNGTLSATNYVFSFTNGTLTVLGGAYGIAWTNPESIIYGTPLGTNENNASATVGGNYSYNPTNGVVLPVGTNLLSVVFTPSDTNYAATNLSVQLVVTPAPLTVTADNQGKVYGQALNLGTSAFTSSGLVNGETIGSVTLASAGAATNAAAGTYAIVPSAAAGGTFNPANYSLTYSNGVLTVNAATLTVTANSTNKIYGAANPAFIASYGGFVNGETISVITGAPSLTSIATTNSGAGAYPIVATNGTLSAANYVFSFVNGTLTVNAATLTVTANDTNKVYGAANPAFTASYSGFVNGETTGVLSGSPSLTTAAILSSPAGTYPITATNGTLSAANYAFNFVNGTLTIVGGSYGITWTNPASIVYGAVLGTNQNNAGATVAGSYVYNPTNGTLLPVGTNTLNVVFTPGDTNYAATNLSVNLVVTPAPLTITAGNTNKVYNTTLSLGTAAYTSSGLVNSETVGGVTLTSAGTVASAPVGVYPITASNATGGTFTPANYSITYSNGTLTVLAAAYTATWPTPTNIVYGTPLGTNQNNATTSIPGTFTYNPTNGTVLPAGTNLLSVVFTPSDTNYASTNLSVNLVVTPAPLAIMADNQAKAYGQTMTLGAGQTAFTSSALIGGDSVASVTLTSTGAAGAAAVGTYPIIPSAAVGSGLTNYSIVYSNGTLTVLGSGYTVIWPTPTNIVYGTPLSALQNNATSSVPGTAVYNPTNGTVLNSGTNTLNVIYTPTDTNYASTNLSVLLVVTPAPLSVTASNVSRLYGQANPALGGTIAGIQNSDNISATYATSATTNSPVGGYPIVPTLADPNSRLVNYVVTTNNGTLTVSKAVLGVTADSTNRLYNTANPAFTASYSGFVNGETISVLSGAPDLTTPAILSSPAGTYPIAATNGTLSATNYAFSFTNGTLTVLGGSYGISWTNPASIVYGTPLGTNQNNASATVGGTYTYNPDNGVVRPAGTNTLNVLFTPSDTNYAATNVSVSLVVLPATLTVTANSTNKVYGAANPAFTTSYSGFVNGETNSVLTGAPGLTTAATTNSGVGGYPIVATNGTLSAANYVFSFVNGTLTIAQAGLSVTASDQTKNYGTTLTLGAGQTAFTSSGLANGETIGSITLAASGGTAALDTPGTYTLTPSAATGGTFSLANYSVSYFNGSLIVTQSVTADLAVFKTGPASALAGSNMVYSITVTNLGPSAATNLVVKDWLPSGFSYISSTPSGATVASNVVTWSVARLAANAKTNFTVTARSAEGGTFTNLATATSDAYDPNGGNSDGSSTNSQARTTVSARADVAVFKTGGTNAYAGGTANYTITVTNLGPSTASNVVVMDRIPTNTTFLSASGSYTITSNVLSWDTLTLSNGATANFTISLQAPKTGSFTNIALSTSPTADPNPTNNNGTATGSRIVTKTVPSADVVVLVSGPPTATQGSNFVYTITVTNAGPSVSSNLVVSDSLPVGLTFVSASGNGKRTNSIVTWPPVKSLAVGGRTNYTVTVNASLLGSFTNVASAIAVTYDPDPTNNTGVTPASRAVTEIGVAQFSILAGTPVFNPQTGLYEETVTVTNNAATTILGFRLHVGGLTNNVTLYNASGTTNGVPFVNYNFPVDPSNAVSLILEFYNPTRQAFTHTLWAEAILPTATGTISTNGAAAASIHADPRTGRVFIEFLSVPGKTYTIIYSDTLAAPVWKVATPSVRAAANVTQWYDDGPPVTDSKPVIRFYRVIQFD